MTAAFARLNKVSSARPYLDGVRFSINEGTMRISVVILVGSLWILSVGASFKGNSLLVIDAAILISYLCVFVARPDFYIL